MKNFTVKQTPQNLGFQVSFIETGRKYEIMYKRHGVNVKTLRAGLCFTGIADMLNLVRLGDTIIGKIARSLPLPNPDGHKRYFVGGLLLYLASAIIVSGFYAVFTATKAAAFKTQFFGCLGGFMALYLFIAFALYVLFILRAQINNHSAPDFWRTITVSASDMEIVINSAQDQLEIERWGYYYRPRVIRMSQVAGIEDSHIAVHQPSVNTHTTQLTAVETANCYEVSLFTTDGKRHVLMKDTSGPDTAREIRTQLAALIHKVQSVIPHIQRLYAANAYDDAAEQRLRNMLYGSNTPSAPQPAATTIYQPIPEADRL